VIWDTHLTRHQLAEFQLIGLCFPLRISGKRNNEFLYHKDHQWPREEDIMIGNQEGDEEWQEHEEAVVA
jgi:hypothetical protein